MISAGGTFSVVGTKPTRRRNSRVEMSFMFIPLEGFAVWKGGVYITETDAAKFTKLPSYSRAAFGRRSKSHAALWQTDAGGATEKKNNNVTTSTTAF